MIYFAKKKKKMYLLFFDYTDFRSTLGRIFESKLVMTNIIAIACVYTVLINTIYEEPNYMESVFFVQKHTFDMTDQNTVIIGK